MKIQTYVTAGGAAGVAGLRNSEAGRRGERALCRIRPRATT